MSIKTQLLDYDVNRYPFPALVGECLRAERLDEIHQGVEYELLTRERDQSTEFHKRFYGIGEHFFAVYRQFLGDVVRPFIGEDVIYQRVPTFRVHLPNNVAVGEFHRDRDYSHGEGEANFWLPVTRAWDTNTVWIESDDGAGDFRPWPCDVGQVLIFDGVNLAHGNKQNTTGKTRVSFDFRLIPKSQFRPRRAKTVNTGLEFSLGGYFEELEPEPNAVPGYIAGFRSAPSR